VRVGVEIQLVRVYVIYIDSEAQCAMTVKIVPRHMYEEKRLKTPRFGEGT
jgi:hypothetical protein